MGKLFETCCQHFSPGAYVSACTLSPLVIMPAAYLAPAMTPYIIACTQGEHALQARPAPAQIQQHLRQQALRRSDRQRRSAACQFRARRQCKPARGLCSSGLTSAACQRCLRGCMIEMCNSL